MNLNPVLIKQQIGNLLVSYPELAEDEALRLDMIEAETDTHAFLSMLVRLIGESKALAASTDNYAAELRERSARIDRRVEAYRSLAFEIMLAADIKRAELPEATLSIRAGTPRVIITNEASLPDIACKFIRKPDLAKIKELLTDDNGTCAGAIMSNGIPSLSVRTK